MNNNKHNSSGPTISIIVAMDEARGIGKNNGLLWHISADLKHFKQLTTGHPIIMGRNTFESIGKPLPNRTNIVVSRNSNIPIEGVIVCNSLEKAIEKAKTIDQGEIFIIGGGQIYQQAIKYAKRLYLTEVKGNFDATIFFPDYAEFNQVVSESEWQKEGKHEFRFLVLEK